MKRISLLAVSLLLFSCAVQPPRPPIHQKQGDYTYIQEYLRWYIKKEMKNKNITGLSIALVDDQKIIWQEGFGYADLDKHIKATPDTIYRAGSISKLFNGLATMKLVETDKMNLDLPLATYLPEFSIKSRFGDTDAITPRTILTHHSGLPSDWDNGMWTKKPQPFTELVKTIRKEYVAYPPNTVMSYSNIGVTLLGHAIQNVSEIEYATFLDQTLLHPMGMENSRFETSIGGQGTSKSYNKGKEVTEFPLSVIPAGGLNTTVVDLAKLAMMVNNKGTFFGNRILSPRSLNDMFTVQNSNVPLDLDNEIGLAWFIDRKTLPNKEPIYSHGGAVIAQRGMFMVAPESKLGVAVLANTGSADPAKIAKEILQRAWEVKIGEKLTKPEHKVSGGSSFSGTYATVMGKVDIERKGPESYSVQSSLGNFTLNNGDDDSYRLNYRLLGLIPIDLEELGEATFHTEHLSNYHALVAEFEQSRFLAGIKVEPHTIHPNWKKRLGRYEILNPPEVKAFQPQSCELKVENEYLVAVVKLAGEKVTQILRTINGDEAVIEGVGRGLGETVRIEIDSQGREILTHSGLNYKLIQ